MSGLMAYALSLYPPGEDQAAIDILNEFWSGLTESKIFKHWTLGYVQGIFSKAGLYDTSPFAETIAAFGKKFTGTFQRRISIGMTDLNEGGFL